MTLVLNPGVSFCLVGPRAIFFDLRRNRYRALNALQTTAFMSGDPIKVLLDGGLAMATTNAPLPQPFKFSPPTRDLAGRAPNALAAGDIVLVGLASLVARATLVSGRLDRLLHGLNRSRAGSRRNLDGAAIEALALRFGRARPWIPIRTECLIDSLALMLFLAWRGHAPRLVFGVEAPPFTAHAWVQHDNCVLNDAIERIVVYTPIQAVG